MQARLDQRMIQCRVLLATGHISKACQIGEHRSGTILSVESEQGVRLGQVGGLEVARDGCEALTQFLAVAPVAAVAKRTEPLEAMSLADNRAGAYHLSPLAPGVPRSTDLIQPAKSRGQVS